MTAGATAIVTIARPTTAVIVMTVMIAAAMIAIAEQHFPLPVLPLFEVHTMRFTLPTLALGILLPLTAIAGDGTTAIGGGLGGALGNVVGQQIGGSTGAAIGAGLGGAAGSAVGARKGNRTQAAVGGGLGSAGGSLIGNSLGGSTGSTIGAGLGGAAGGAVGNHLADDSRHTSSSKKHKRKHRH